jgi:UDP-N-acetylmuramoylalanine--D-glutamate ligase
MIPARSYSGKTVGAFGLARSGLATVRALKAGGAEVIAWDDKEPARNAAQADGATVLQWRNWPWDRLAALILSPGIPLTHNPHDIVVRARQARVPIIGDVELFGREIRSDKDTASRAPVIAITGTNGKSTTTALIGHILNACGFAAEVGGNIGKAVLELDPPAARTVYVIEMSSYQIDLSPGFVPDVSILSNITPDHLDRHGTMENYAAVKESLLHNTARTGSVVIGVDDSFTSGIFTKMAATGGASAVPVSVRKVLGRGVFVVDGILYDAQSQRPTPVVNLREAANLPGVHNWQNAALAYAAVKPYVKDSRAISSAILTFPGLAHRIETVGFIGKTRFVNDSKATNAEAAERALVCYPDIFWIAGGKAKDGGIESLSPHFSRIHKAYLIGDAAEAFGHTLKDKVEYEIAGTLDVAVRHAAEGAARSAAPAPVVLLSPACASFDQFKDFEQRGDAFRAIFTQLSTERQAS